MANAKRHGNLVYKPEYCEIVYNLLRDGASMYEIAYELNVTRKTIWKWQKDHEEFGNAFKDGEDLERGWWEKQGRINLCNKEFCQKLYELNMHNRFGWNKKTENTSTHNVTVREETAAIQKAREEYKKDV